MIAPGEKSSADSNAATSSQEGASGSDEATDSSDKSTQPTEMNIPRDTGDPAQSEASSPAGIHDEDDMMKDSAKPPDDPDDPSLEPLVSIAVEDLAQRLDISEREIEILEVRKVVWPDASLGCPQPGKVYAQIQVDGLLIRLRAGGRMYFYHSGGTQEPFLCEETSRIVPKVTPKVDEFVPPPDSEID